ncbi:MAG: bifunctional serine/threonine-protein kinase/formylglycine-generating enzyme family protein, partial [Acidobacteria bacterium]|nr:bifunctional serine/threonine-protein kinase/formylglycine-generating enzyme family protein [Acidobacteriota bacterium]
IVDILYSDSAEDKEREIEIPFILMEYINGSSLEDLLKSQEKLEWNNVLNISQKILNALSFIHEKTIIHRDIKPANIMIESESGKPVLIDFGMAKDILGNSNITKIDGHMGTPLYMSPEQWEGIKDLTPASDIYSFGVVLYRMLTGEVPFNGKNSFEIMHGHWIKDIPDIIKSFPQLNLPLGIEKVLFKAMAKEPKDRYENAEQFRDAIRQLSETPKRIETDKNDGDAKAGESKKEEPPNNNINNPVVEEPARIETKKEDGEEEKTPEIIIKPPGRKFKYVVYISVIIIAIAAFFFLKFYIPGWKYDGFIDSAKTLIQSNELEKAGDALKKAREIKGKDTKEIVALYNEILSKRIEAMKGNFEILKKFLASGATINEKIEKCREFLAKHQNTAGNNDTQAIRDEANRFISNLNADIKAGDQYQRYMDTVNNLIKNEDFEGAKRELDKAEKINNSHEVKRLSITIAQGIESQRKNGDKEYKTIKDKLTLSQYQAFQRNYPQSIHFPDLKERLKVTDKNLPPEKYWDKLISKNGKGYYEFIFGNEPNGHRMIYIPEKNFWIDKYEVSWAQFRKFVNDANIQFHPIQGSKYINNGYEYPAVVSYENAQNYCRRYGLRLPSAEEWEYAAGKGTSIYPWGNESPDEAGIWRANFDSLKDGFEGTAPVKSFEKFSSTFGGVNMSGNVWEWVQQNILKGGGYLSLLEKNDLKIEKKKNAKPNDKEGFRCLNEEK